MLKIGSAYQHRKSNRTKRSLTYVCYHTDTNTASDGIVEQFHSCVCIFILNACHRLTKLKVSLSINHQECLHIKYIFMVLVH